VVQAEYGEQTAKDRPTVVGQNSPTDEKKKVSPRRLDYALQVRRMKGDMRDDVADFDPTSAS
jgi:hypothetical protein